MHSKLLAGTAKGLIICGRRNSRWEIENVQFEGLPVSLVYTDDRTDTWWVGISHRHWGEKLYRSEDRGAQWNEVNVPGYKDKFYQPGQPATLKKIWCMHHAGADRPGGLWLGTEPGGLFYSNNNGETFVLNESLWNHPSRVDKNQWFGAGKDYPFIHSIVLDPRDSNHLYVAVSCAGVFETKDAGNSWKAVNQGLVAAYLPNPSAEVGHDPHRVILCTAMPDVLWQQNHCGIFRTTTAASSWIDVSGSDGFPSYGFALAIDEANGNIAWVIPAIKDEQRIPVGLKLSVCKTIDGGQSWRSQSNGLPDNFVFDLVLRHAFVKNKSTLAFGTNNGNLYVSENAGDLWRTISQNLAAVNCLIMT